MWKINWPQELQSSCEQLERAWTQRRLGHAVLIVCDSLAEADAVAEALAEGILAHRLPHPDCEKVQPTNKQRQIGTEAMRGLREFLQKSSLSGAKVAHVSQADRLNSTSANLFLKILEEPPAGSYILLTTAEPYGVLPTLLSRTMRFRIKSAQGKPHEAALEKWREEFKEFLRNPAENNSLMRRMGYLAEAYRLLQAGEDSNAPLAAEGTPKEVLEAVEASRQKAFKKEFYATLERAALEAYEENPQESYKLRGALNEIERIYKLTEFNLNGAAALEAAINTVADHLSTKA